MSSIAARAAFRASTRAAAQAKQTRQFSVVRNVRNVVRSFEPHPYSRLPIANKAQAGDYAKIAKRVGGNCVAFAAAVPVILGWPYFVQLAFRDHQ